MKKQIYTSATLLLLSLTGLEALGQSKIKDNTIIGTSSLPRAGSILELESSNKGAMMPRVSLTSTTTWGLLGIDSAGMVVYNNNPAITAGSAAAPILGGGLGFYYWDGDRWVGMSAGAGTGDYWRLKGNAGTTPPTTVGTAVGAANYWGTTDAQNLAVGTNGTTRAIFDRNGSLYGGSGTYDATLNPLQSLVWGSNNKDSASYTLVAGQNNTVRSSATNTLMAGALNYASGLSAAVFGAINKDSASYTLMAGRSNVIAPLGLYSAVVGSDNKSNGAYNFIAGTLNTANGAYNLISGLKNIALYPGTSYNIIGGWENSVSANYSLVAGHLNITSGTSNSAVFGESNKDSASYTLVAGQGNTVSTTMPHAAVVGKYNAPVANALLTVGNGNSAATKQNAFTVTSTPTAGSTNNGIVIMSAQLPVYTSLAAALADATLPSGAFFRMNSGTAGISAIYMKD